MFGKSPVGAIEKHADVCLRCAEGLRPLFESTGADERAAALDEIIRLEKEADQIKREIRQQLRGRLFMPVSRTDVLELVYVQDKIANRARDIGLMYCQRFEKIPDALQPRFKALLDRNLSAVAQARKSVHELDELYETGFRGAEVEVVARMVAELDRLEGESDRLQWEVGDKLREVESEMSAVDVMFLYRIIASISRLGDHADRTGRQLELLFAEWRVRHDHHAVEIQSNCAERVFHVVKHHLHEIVA